MLSLKKAQKPDAEKAAMNNQKAGQVKNNSNNANTKTNQLNSKTVSINEKGSFVDLADLQETDLAKEEDLLANVAFRLQIIIKTTTGTTTTDLDFIIDTILLLWRKCRVVFEKCQTGSEENFRWVLKLDNKWLYILNIVHEAMCRFGFTTIDLQLFMHCSVRLGSAYESLAIAWSKKLVPSSKQQEITRSDEQSTGSGGGWIETCLEKYIPPANARDNYMKAK